MKIGHLGRTYRSFKSIHTDMRAQTTKRLNLGHATCDRLYPWRINGKTTTNSTRGGIHTWWWTHKGWPIRAVNRYTHKQATHHINAFHNTTVAHTRHSLSTQSAKHHHHHHQAQPMHTTCHSNSTLTDQPDHQHLITRQHLTFNRHIRQHNRKQLQKHRHIKQQTNPHTHTQQQQHLRYNRQLNNSHLHQLPHKQHQHTHPHHYMWYQPRQPFQTNGQLQKTAMIRTQT